jgi:O-antigen/teichoic acid export membrane protein
MTFLTNVVVMFLSFIVNIPLNRMLGPANKGIYAYFFLIPGMIMMFSNFGFFGSTTYYSANKKYSIEKVVSQALYMIVILFIFMSGIFFMWLLFTKDQIFLDNQVFIPFILLFLLISLFNDFFSGIIQGLNKISQYNFSRLLYGALNIIALLIIMFFFKTDLLYLIIAEGVLVYIPAVFFIIRQSPTLKMLPFDFNYLKNSFRYGIKIYFAGLSGYLHLNIDMLIISRLLSMSQLGLYSLAVGLAEKFLLVLNASAFALVPRACADGGNYELTSRICRINITIGIIFTIFVVTIVKPLIVLVYSVAFAKAAVPLSIILPGIVIWSIPTMIGTDLGARDKVKYTVYSSLFALFSNIALNYLLIPKFGINGAALASTITYSLSAITMIYFYAKVVPEMKVNELLFLKKSDVTDIFSLVKNKLDGLRNV